jgi:hypothetical protein
MADMCDPEEISGSDDPILTELDRILERGLPSSYRIKENPEKIEINGWMSAEEFKQFIPNYEGIPHVTYRFVHNCTGLTIYLDKNHIVSKTASARQVNDLLRQLNGLTCCSIRN